MSRRPTPTGLDWAAVTASYVAHGGELEPEVWGSARKAQAEALRAASNGEQEKTRRPVRASTGRPSHNPLGRGAAVELSRQQLQDIIDRYRGGEPSPSIAQSYKIASNTVLRLLRAEGVEIRGLKKFVEPSRIPALIERYSAGETIGELADSEGVGRVVMSQSLMRAGLKMRNPSEARSMAAQVRRKADR
jgi:hypothetical protein